MKTGSGRLSLAAIADKLIAEKQFGQKSQEWSQLASLYLHTSYLFSWQKEHPELAGKDFEVCADAGIVLL